MGDQQPQYTDLSDESDLASFLQEDDRVDLTIFQKFISKLWCLKILEN